MGERPELRSELLDLSHLRLDELDFVADSVLAAAVRRIMAENDSAEESYATFTNWV
jgi:FXSXX-COOH protein